QVQRTGAGRGIWTVGGVGLLLGCDDYRSRAQRMHGTGRYVDHFTRLDVDPVQQLFGALVMNRLLELFAGNPRLQAESDLSTRPGVRHVPTLGLPPRLPSAAGSFIVGMHLDR